jgi:hypothetical protein
MTFDNIINNIDVFVHLSTFLMYLDILAICLTNKNYMAIIKNNSFWDKLISARAA